MKILNIITLVVLMGTFIMCQPESKQQSGDTKQEKEEMANEASTEGCGKALNFKMDTITQEPKNLCDYQGKVVMVVNTASECGLTPQYAGLEKIYNTYKDKGFVILGFPANDFGKQEPGSDQEIKQFCDSKYKITFPMFSKISVKGDQKAPLYQYLTESAPKEDIQGEIKWNFQKFLINREGEVIKRFEPTVEPESEEITQAIESLL